MADLVSFVNEKGMVSSKVVAEKFGKRHDNVLRDCVKLIDSLPTDFIALNFEVRHTATLKSNGKEVSEVSMSRDGFSLLAMGFTGKLALSWKVRFLDAFNQMEQAVLSEMPRMQNRIKELECREQLRIESEMAKKLRSETRRGIIPTYTSPLFAAFDEARGLLQKTLALPKSMLTESEIATNERIHCSHRLKGVSEELDRRERYERAILAWEKLSPEQRIAIPRPERSSFGLR